MRGEREGKEGEGELDADKERLMRTTGEGELDVDEERARRKRREISTQMKKKRELDTDDCCTVQKRISRG